MSITVPRQQLHCSTSYVKVPLSRPAERGWCLVEWVYCTACLAEGLDGVVTEEDKGEGDAEDEEGWDQKDEAEEKGDPIHRLTRKGAA